MKRAQSRAHLLGTDRRRRPGLRSAAAIVLAAGLTSGLAACGDDEEDIDDVDVDVTTDMGSDDTGMAPGTTMDGATDLTTGGTATGDSATVTTPVSGSVSNDDGGTGGTSAP